MYPISLKHDPWSLAGADLGSEMKRISQMQMYRTGNLTRLRELKDGDVQERWFNTIATVEIYLQQFIALNKDTIPQSTERVEKLMSAVHNLVNPNRGPPHSVRNRFSRVPTRSI